MSRNTTSGRHLVSLERRRQAIELRKQGLSYQAIGDRLGIAKPSVYAHVRAALVDLARDTTDMTVELRDIEIGKLDALEEALSPAAMEGDAQAASTLIRLMARRAKLCGLDMAREGNGGMTITVIDPNNYTPPPPRISRFPSDDEPQH